jgi:hypothetical protein
MGCFILASSESVAGRVDDSGTDLARANEVATKHYECAMHHHCIGYKSQHTQIPYTRVYRTTAAMANFDDWLTPLLEGKGWSTKTRFYKSCISCISCLSGLTSPSLHGTSLPDLGTLNLSRESQITEDQVLIPAAWNMSVCTTSIEIPFRCYVNNINPTIRAHICFHPIHTASSNLQFKTYLHSSRLWAEAASRNPVNHTLTLG